MFSHPDHRRLSHAIPAISCQDVALCCRMVHSLKINRHRGLTEECFLHAAACPDCRIDGLLHHQISTQVQRSQQGVQDYQDMFRLDIGWNMPDPTDDEFARLASRLAEHHLPMVRAFIATRIGDWPVPRSLSQLQFQILTSLLNDPHHYVIERAGRGLVTVGIPSSNRQRVLDTYREFEQVNPDYLEQSDKWTEELNHFRLV